MLPSDYDTQRLIAAPDHRLRERRLDTVRGRLSGSIVANADRGWDAARRAWNRAATQRPPLVVFPETVDDIVEIVAFARAEGLQVVPQNTGRGAAALGPIEDAVLVRSARMSRVEIDASGRRARVEAGAIWGSVQSAAAAHGLAGLAGTSPEIGVVGYTLGGGLGWLSRRYGFACNSVLAMDVVTADGRAVRVDDDHEPDLFWALRGGGGDFAIVTALEFALYPVRELYAGAMYWPHERAAEVLEAWQAWTTAVPDTTSSIGRILHVPSSAHVPVTMRGRSFVAVEAACMTTEDEEDESLRPLRELRPEIDTFAMMPPVELGELHLDPVEPMPVHFDGWLLEDLPAAAIEAMLGSAGPASSSALMSVELRHLGGALAEGGPGHGALASVDAGFAAVTLGVAPDGDLAPVERQSARVRSALAPWTARQNYPNFAEERPDGASIYLGETLERLRRVHEAYDPGDLIRSGRPVATGAAGRTATRP